MFKRFVDAVQLVVAGLGVLTVVLLFVVQPTVASDTPSDTLEGAALYSSNCSGCHGTSGGGGVGPALAGEDALTRFDNAGAVAKFVAVGAPGRMPGFETRLSPDEINAIAEFVFGGFEG